MKVLGIIPARGGSKGVYRKNIRLLAGKPLLAYTAEAALKSQRLARIILTTEDNEIAEIARQCGIDVPFMRPAELAEDTTPTLPVIQHALRKLSELGEEYDAVCLLQPTNPLRRSKDVDNCIELLESTGADSVVSVLPVPAEFNPAWVYVSGSNGFIKLLNGEDEPIPRRQDLPAAFHRDGTVYVTTTSVILDRRSLYGSKIHAYEIDPSFSMNIDTEEDWNTAQSRIRSVR